MSHEPLANCNDPSTWKHKDEKIDLPRLLALIDAHGGPDGLDLHGCDMTGIDLSYAALSPYLQQWTGTQPPPWVYGMWGINLRGAHLEEAKFTSANLDGADLSQANLRGASLRSASLLHVSLRQAALQGAHLEDARILHANLGGAMLVHAHLEGAIVQHTSFENASLKFAHLQGAILEGCDLARVDLSECYLTGVRWYGAFLDRSRMRRDQLGHAIGDELWASDEKTAQAYREASEAYLLLKNNFNSIGRYEDASWAYVKEQQMRKMACHWEWRWWPWQAWRSFWGWLRNWAFELATGYGERPFNPVAGGALAVVGFALGYYFTGAISNIWDAFVFSLATFATFNLADLQPEGRGVDIASSVEALLGISVLALVVFTLGNRMSRS